MAKINNQSQITSKYTLPDQTEKQNITQSNVASTENMTTSFKKERSSEKNYGLAGEEILQTLTLTNESDFEIKNVNISEQITDGATFKEGSVKIDGVEHKDFDIETGFDLPSSIASMASASITYILVIDDSVSVEDLSLKSVIEYNINDELNFSEESNAVEIKLATEKIVINKTASKIAVSKGQVITFENVIKNLGNVVNTEVMFKDVLPAETEFIKGTVNINGQQKYDLDPTVGFSLDDLQPNDEITVKFDVKVK